MLRLPEGMRDRIRVAAEANGRSMNAEIVHALEGAFPGNAKIDEIAAAIVAEVEKFKSEKKQAKREATIEGIRDLQLLLQKELDDMVGTSQIADDEDYIKWLK
ncbi:Arc-like DNA binding domain protein [Roseivivax sp. THAF40]|nr:Arc-like DNA binding domain protein [Roseivivax sp. THAF40]